MVDVSISKYLEDSTGLKLEAFLLKFPHCVLIEVESQIGSGNPEVTEKLHSGLIRKQSQASRHAQVCPLDEAGGGVVVGRGPHCGVHVNHPSISKEHARFDWLDGKLHLQDLGSTNVTQHNGVKLSPNTQSLVKPNDTVCFGRAKDFHVMDPTEFFNYLEILRRFSL